MFDLAIVGSRGLPARYGGFETFAEEIGTRLSSKGLRVLISCEERLQSTVTAHAGVVLIGNPLRPPRTYVLRKGYEVFSDLYFMLRLCRSTKTLYVLGYSAAIFMFLPKALGRNLRLLVNIDGVEWKRGKFNRFERALLKVSVTLASAFAGGIVVDSRAMGRYVLERYRSKAVWIPYGARPTEDCQWNQIAISMLAKRCPGIARLKPNGYWLAIARLEPENNVQMMIKGFLDSGSKRFLLLVGDSTSKRYEKTLRESLARDVSQRIVLVGSIYSKPLLEMLRQHCLAYIHGHSVGGTNPSLLEAMSSKAIVLAHDNEFNHEVCLDTALYFKDARELSLKLGFVEQNLPELEKLKLRATERAREAYSWDFVTQRLCSLLAAREPDSREGTPT